MNKLTIILACVCSCCFGQADYQSLLAIPPAVSAAVSEAFYPTNIANKSYTFWSSDNYTTNSGRATITEQMGTGLQADAATTAAPYRIESRANGYASLSFNSVGGGSPLTGSGYYVANTLHEIMAVVSYTNNGGNGYVFCGTNSVNYHALRLVDTVPRYDVNVGGTVRSFDGTIRSGIITVYSCIFSNGNNMVFTNGVLVGNATTSNGTVGNEGIRIGAKNDNGNPAQMEWFAMATYTNILTSTERAGAVSAFRTRYGF